MRLKLFSYQIKTRTNTLLKRYLYGVMGTLADSNAKT